MTDYFIGKYIRPVYFHSSPEYFLDDHDPIDKGIIFSRDIDLITNYLDKHPYMLNVREPFFKNSALFIACEYDFPEVVELLLSRYANISDDNLFKWKPLDVAKYHQSHHSLNILREYAALLIQNWWRKHNVIYKMKNKLILN